MKSLVARQLSWHTCHPLGLLECDCFFLLAWLRTIIPGCLSVQTIWGPFEDGGGVLTIAYTPSSISFLGIKNSNVMKTCSMGIIDLEKLPGILLEHIINVIGYYCLEKQEHCNIIQGWTINVKDFEEYLNKLFHLYFLLYQYACITKFMPHIK